MKNEALIALAKQARECAYAPYSHFCVGAALLADDGRVFTGCNIENVSYSATVCAERVAIGKAVSEGCTAFSKIAIVGGMQGTEPSRFCMPCGVCRQVMREFCKDDFVVLVIDGERILETTLAQLLPAEFSADFTQEM